MIRLSIFFVTLSLLAGCIKKDDSSAFDLLVLAALASQQASKTFLVVTSTAGNKVYSIQASGGTMSLVQSVDHTTPYHVAFHPTLNVAYVTGQDQDNVVVYSINSSGNLSIIETETGGPMNDSRGCAVSPDGKHLYVTNMDGNSVSVFSIDQSSGALTHVETDTTGTLNQPSSVRVSANGSFIHVASQGGNTLQAYTRDSGTGAITASGGTIATGTVPIDIGITSDNKYLYTPNVNNAPDNVSAYSINSGNGQLSLVETENANGNAGSAIVSPNNRWLYSGSSSNNASRFEISSANGSLSTKADISIVPTPRYAAFNSAGTFMYWTTFSGNSVRSFSADPSTGNVTSLSTLSVGTEAFRIALKVIPN